MNQVLKIILVKLGWVDELSLSKIILNEIKKINISEITKPIKFQMVFLF